LGTTPARSAIGANGQYYDSWGTAYNTAIDTNYNNVVVAPGYTDLAASYTTATNGDSGVPTGVIGWSYGKNQMQAASFTGSDDVISWQ
jgi:hypothetical protein